MDEREHIVIVGAGIIGVCTAYFLTQHPEFDESKYRITILEARRAAGAASGKAGGLLAMWAFPQQIVPLSFGLHQELADKFDGETEWGYRRLNTMSVEGTLYGRHIAGSDGNDQSPVEKGKKYSKPPRSSHLPQGLDWIHPEIVDGYSDIGDEQTTAQVHPHRFTTFMLKKTLECKAAELVIGKVTKLRKDSAGAVIGVSYDNAGGESFDLDASKVVLTLGPWTSKILPSCPISGLRAHSITIKPTREVSPFALFTELRVQRGKYISPEVYPRRDEVYVCGEGETIPIPETSDDVEVDKSKCDELFSYAGQISSELKGGRLLRRQACYLPVIDVASCSGPFIGNTNVDNLLLASGHSCWGINNAPATGKLMSEIILEGEAKSASIAGLEPSAFFDAGQ